MILHKHNSETYANMVSLFQTEQRVAAVQPTGTGKSYLIMQLIEDNADKRFAVCSPSTYIFEQMKSLADENRISLDNTDFLTYTKLSQTEAFSEYNYIVLDEFHRCGADEWGQGVQRLLDSNPNAKVFGTSATPIRYLDSGRNMADELFNGVYAVNMSLAEAIRRKILPLPVYVTSWYSFRGDIEQLEMKAEQSGNPRLKNALLGKIRKAKSMIAELDVGIEKIFEKHIRNKAGKFIVFCPNVEQLRRMVNECDSWFEKVNRDIHKYTVYAQNSASDKQFEDFRNDKSDSALKLLFCIDMLNEGVHFDDVDGVIMLRATQSANVFYQQLGRALACSDSKKKPVIFDIVNNYETGDTAQQYAGFMEIARGEGDYDDEIEFELYDYVRDIREILNELNDTFANSWDFNFELLKEYAEKYHAFPDGNTSYEGVLIGKWANQQRTLNNQGKLSKNRVDKLNSIDFPWDVNEASWQTFYEELKSTVESLGHFPKKSEFGSDKTSLYRWVTTQKNKYRNGTLEEDKAQKLIAIGCEITKGMAEYWQENCDRLGEFVKQHGRFPNYADVKSDPELKVLYVWANSQRTARYRGQLSEERIAMLDSIGFTWDKHEEEWLNAFNRLRSYFKEFGSLPGINEVVDGYKLGKWYKSQVVLYLAGNMQAHRVERFKEAGIPLENLRQRRKNEVFMKYYDSYMEYLQKFGRHPASKDRYNDLDLVKWRCTQMQKKRQGKLTDELAELLMNICKDL
ncbi:Superfamily II DNA or RNA helicase [Ruminococcus sp. YE71]|uniref:Helicase associated domain protein n=1 Tax=unclassified Ruminococcus TaxID=2608920 RepID=UPI0008836B8D|nr:MULTISPECIES: Helicase associated domain protein [unclassified Ruminococcus]SDA30797.1 Superfamily II DNA or RNA helicase [Ruminococcus sp. YE78]SFW50467.1 Superfamily II DNA or RNA helicase [Ruminococcus sp. YE71]